MIVYNTTKKPIFITTQWTPDPLGGPAVLDTHYCIGPGQGIDLSILGLKAKPKKTAMRTAKKQRRSGHD